MNNYDDKNITVFALLGSELYAIAKNEYKLDFNELSAFAKHPGIGSTLSDEAKALSVKSSFKEAVQILASPAYKILFNVGGNLVNRQSFSAYFAANGKEYSVVTLHDLDGRVLVMAYRTKESFCGWWADSFASRPEYTPANLIKPEISLETFLCILNLADCYRRTHIANLLNFQIKSIDEIYEDEFIAVLESAAKSGDARWLMPSLLVLVPNFDGTVLEFSAEHMKDAEVMDFFSHSRNKDNGRPVLLLGSPGQYLGMEFTHFWSTSVGFEINSTTGGEMKGVGKYYFAATREANHLVSFITGENEKYQIKHEELSYEGLIDAFKKLVDYTQQPETNKSKPEAGGFCSNCGTKLSDAAKFCIKCGNKV